MKNISYTPLNPVLLFMLALVCICFYVLSFAAFGPKQECQIKDPITKGDLRAIEAGVTSLLNDNKAYWNGYAEGLSACYSTQK